VIQFLRMGGLTSYCDRREGSTGTGKGSEGQGPIEYGHPGHQEEWKEIDNREVFVIFEEAMTAESLYMV
jgi:hypothetical protein